MNSSQAGEGSMGGGNDIATVMRLRKEGLARGPCLPGGAVIADRYGRCSQLHRGYMKQVTTENDIRHTRAQAISGVTTGMPRQ